MLSMLLASCAPASNSSQDTRTPLQRLGISNINVAQVGNNLALSWTNPTTSNIVSYNITLIEYTDAEDETPNSERTIESAAANQAELVINFDNLVANRYYEIEIVVIGANDTILLRTSLSANTALANRLVSGSPPTVPENFQFSIEDSTSLNVSWTAPSAASTRYEYYQLERRLSNMPFSIVTDQPLSNLSTFYLDDDLTTGTNYAYRINACRLVNNLPICSDYVNIMQAAPLAIPSDFQTAVQGPFVGALRLSWGQSLGAQYYNISRTAVGVSGETNNIVDAPSAEYIDEGLPLATQYFYRISACANGVCTDYSTTRLQTTPADMDADTIGDDFDDCIITMSPVWMADLATDGDLDGCRDFDQDDDDDNDEVLDLNDIDADGDGLIEIYNAIQLNWMRHNLNGTGLDAENTDNDNTTGGIMLGCGGMNTGISACGGYELNNSIDLNDLVGEVDGYKAEHNWERVGYCIDAACTSGANFFSGTFDGNDYSIENLRMLVDDTNQLGRLFSGGRTEYQGVGFFGAIGENSIISNIHITNVNISSVETVNLQKLGGLIGYADGAIIGNLSVSGDLVSGRIQVGGLAGRVSDVFISKAIAVLDVVEGSSEVGGLVGDLGGSSVRSSASVINTIDHQFGSNFGGLVGQGSRADISGSAAFVSTLFPSTAAGGQNGGLVGNGRSVSISSSYAIVDAVGGGLANLGGLVGQGDGATVVNSWALSNSIPVTYSFAGVALVLARNQVHQLVGGVAAPSSITNSYWENSVNGGVTTGFINPSPARGSGQSMSDLQTPTAFSGIYANWANAWCDSETGEFTTDADSPLAQAGGGNANRVWDLGTSSQYPVISCFGELLSPQQQRTLIDRIANGDELLPLP